MPHDPLLDTARYPMRELVPFMVGCALWVVVYAIFVRDGLKGRPSEMPMFAGASNLAWEFLWGFGFKPDMGLMIVWGYRAWFFLDIFIFWLLVRNGSWQFANPRLRARFVPLSVASVAFWFAAYWSFIADGHDTPIGANSAYIAQAFISVMYLYQILGAEDAQVANYSWPVAWMRSIGSGLTTVFMFMHYMDGQHRFVLWVSGTCLAADLACIALLGSRRRALQTRTPTHATAS